MVAVTWFLIFLENFLSLSTEYSALNFPFNKSAKLLAIGGPLSSEQLREEQISDNKLAFLHILEVDILLVNIVSK